MDITKSVTTTITLTSEELPFDAVLEYEPASWIDPIIVQNDDGIFTVTYAVLDGDPSGWHPINDLDGLEFEEFQSEDARDEYIEETDLTTHVPFVVNHYEHGAIIYSLAEPTEYEAWDSRPSCVLRVSVEFTEPREAAAAILAEYTAWANGDIYGLVREFFDAEGEHTEESDVLWGISGAKQAEEAVKDPDEYM